jgi:hypothetical protein
MACGLIFKNVCFQDVVPMLQLTSGGLILEHVLNLQFFMSLSLLSGLFIIVMSVFYI